MTLAEHAEDLVAAALERARWSIRGRNFRRTGCELDLVAAKGETLVIVEVKCRKRWPRTDAEATALLPPAKRRALIRGAKWWLAVHPTERFQTIRFDLAVVKMGRPPAFRYYVDVLRT